MWSWFMTDDTLKVCEASIKEKLEVTWDIDRNNRRSQDTWSRREVLMENKMIIWAI